MFDWVGWRDEHCFDAGSGPIYRRQRVAVQLAMRGQGHLVDQHDRGGDHVAGKLLLQEPLQFVGRQLLIRSRKDIGDKPLFTAPVAVGDHNRSGDLLMSVQSCFYFTHLYAEAANLDLVVDSAQVLDVSLRDQPS